MLKLLLDGFSPLRYLVLLHWDDLMKASNLYKQVVILIEKLVAALSP